MSDISLPEHNPIQSGRTYAREGIAAHAIANGLWPPPGQLFAIIPNGVRPTDCYTSHGRQETMKQSTKDKVEGKVHEVKGAAKEKIGQATNNPRLQDEGTGEKVAGKVQKKVGQVEQVIDN
ncbi:MAG TPA: CsbD family protein [Bryobacteraceae bacterium]